MISYLLFLLKENFAEFNVFKNQIYMKYLITFVFALILVYFISVITSEDGGKIPIYWFFVLILVPRILGGVFPKLKELGIGTIHFIPNLINYIRSK